MRTSLPLGESLSPWRDPAERNSALWRCGFHPIERRPRRGKFESFQWRLLSLPLERRLPRRRCLLASRTYEADWTTYVITEVGATDTESCSRMPVRSQSYDH